MDKSIGKGDVVYYKGGKTKYVIVKEVNYEDYGSCCYDRIYYGLPLEEIKKLDYVKEGDYLVELNAQGVMELPFELVEDEAPFEIKKEVRYNIRRKTPKTVIVYE